MQRIDKRGNIPMSTSLPDTMTCVEISEPGGPDVLKPATRPLPEVRGGEVLIRVAWAGVNRPDVAQRAGSYPAPKNASDLPGLEASGTVVAVGPGVTALNVGTEVTALLNGGGYAEYVNVPADTCLPVPKGMDLRTAAAIPETAFTVWHNVFERAGLRPGESFLVHGGSSGIGSMAIQLAKALEATVFTTAGSEEKCAFCRDLGADVAINYKTETFEDVIAEKSGGRGVDVILDMVGGDYIKRNLKILAEDGRLAQIAFLTGSKVELNLAPFMVKRQTLTGSTLRAQSDAAKARLAAEVAKHVWPLIEAGKAAPLIHAEFPFTQANEAHRLMETSAHMGKILLKVSG